MRILQLIDSLQPGGAEKMAVNFANAWADNGYESYLIASHKGGALESQVQKNVTVKIFKRTKLTTPLVVIYVLLFLIRNRITHIQAHTSSYKWAPIVKRLLPSIQFYWHDHNGNRVNWPKEQNVNIINASGYFDGVFACNDELTRWAKLHLKTSNVNYVPNFNTPEVSLKVTKLKGIDGKRIVCIANWRHPKNHLFLVKAFHQSEISEKGWSLHLIGKQYHDDYQKVVEDYITENQVKSIYSYGLCTDTNYIASQAEIGVLVSTYEGFPVTILEYGLAKLYPIASNVGQIPELISDFGLLINPNNPNDLIGAFKKLETNQWQDNAMEFHQHICKNYSSSAILNNLKGIISNV